MRGLLYKEFYQFKIYLYCMGVLAILFLVQGIGAATDIEAEPQSTCMILSMIYLFVIFVGSILSSEFFTKDEKRPWCNFAFALPQTEKGQVTAKYYAVLIWHLALLFLCFITDTIAIAVYGSAEISAVTVAVVVFAFRMLVMAFEIPCMVRYGATTGINVEGSVVGILLMLAGIYALFGDISFFLQENVRDAILDFLMSGNVIWILALLPYVAGIAYYVSYRVSLKMYRKGAESYGQ
ncbi:MAG: ABC-2 transporter permease [Lachnospiraceae bacterium]|nr:ABC-2 transporter permease [Lachnospiraceae bacterium]